jgi:hypothetical protein
MKTVMIFIVGMAILGCGGASSTPKSSNLLEASSFDCEKSFQSDWCSANLQTDSNISSVCSGKIYSGDIIYYSLYLKSNSGNSCLVDLGLGSESLTISGCSSASRIQYSVVTGVVDVMTCSDSIRANTYVEGTNSDGVKFRAIHFQ